MPKISVIIASYNHETFIERALRSVLDQDHTDFELVIVDDGSPDNSVNVIRSLDDSRIRLHCFEKNQGISAAVRKLFDMARGEYVALMASDDMFLPGKLSKQDAYLDAHPHTAAVFSQARIVDEFDAPYKDRDNPLTNYFGPTQNRSRHDWLNFFFKHGNCLCGPSVMVRRSAYDVIGRHDVRMRQVQDFDYWVRMCMHFDIHIMPEELVAYRVMRSRANASAATPEAILRAKYENLYILRHYRTIQTLDELARIFPEMGLDPQDTRHRAAPFFLAMLALGLPETYHALFGINTLFELLGDEQTAAWLEAEFGFTIKDFYEITGTVDAFNMGLALEAQDFFPFRLKRRINKKLGRAAPGADIQAITRKFFDRFNNA